MPTRQMPVWLRTLPRDIGVWLERITVQGHPGWLWYCSDGALHEPGPMAGLAFSCLGLKLAYLFNLTSTMRQEDLVQWGDHIKTFQRRDGPRKGFFEDPLILREKDRWFRRDFAVRRGETRQAFVTLLSVGQLPRVPLPVIASHERGICEFIRGLPWSSDPWGAGSHASLLMVFIEANARWFGRTSERDRLMPVILNEMNRLQDPVTGCWKKGSPDPDNVLNGAMKVLSGYAFLGVPFSYCEQLVDFALTRAGNRDACHHVDLVYVLHQCVNRTNYRRDDIERYAFARVEQIYSFHRVDGGFSFHKDHSGTQYYGVRVAEGKAVSDIHGTKLVAWALVMLADMLGWRETLKWNLTYT